MKTINRADKIRISSEQIVAARALLRWRQLDLAEHVGIGPTQICDYERGLWMPSSRMYEIVSIFEDEGIRFLDSTEGLGVVLRKHTNQSDTT